jgi:hypothetical protein
MTTKSDLIAHLRRLAGQSAPRILLAAGWLVAFIYSAGAGGHWS